MIADVNIKYYSFHINSDIKHVKSVFRFRRMDGISRLERVSLLEDKEINVSEYLYIHLQKRKMKNYAKLCDDFMIVPNAFVPPQEIDKNLIKKNSKRKIYFDYYKLRFNNLCKKLYRMGD